MKPRIIRIEPVKFLLAAIESHLREVDAICKEDAVCDHSAGICWCAYLRRRETLDRQVKYVREILEQPETKPN